MVRRTKGFVAGVSLLLLLMLGGCVVAAGRKGSAPAGERAEPETTGERSEVPGESAEVSGPESLPGLVMVSVSNGPGARPQSGINEADLVFEVPTEGGISRLLLGFTRRVDEIGPVRSVRRSMVEIALGYGAPFGHCGASNDAYALIRETGAPSLDDIRTAGGCFWRNKVRSAPDNLYTSTDNLVRYAEARGFELPSFSNFPEKSWEGKPAVYVEYDFSWLPRYPNTVSYSYEDGTYHRSQGGQKHLDSRGTGVAPENLVFMEVSTEFVTGEAIEVKLDLSSGGRALFFSGGEVTEGTWSKKSLRSPVEFYIHSRPASFMPGQVWIHVVRDLSLVKYR